MKIKKPVFNQVIYENQQNKRFFYINCDEIQSNKRNISIINKTFRKNINGEQNYLRS